VLNLQNVHVKAIENEEINQNVQQDQVIQNPIPQDQEHIYDHHDQQLMAPEHGYNLVNFSS
jgi:hypothetical protein